MLEEEGIADSTLVIFVSDHGDMTGDHDLYVKGLPLYDPTVKVPLLIRWPQKCSGNMVIDALVQPSDLFSLCLSAAGIQDDQMRDSRDLLPVIEGTCDSVHDIAVCEYRNSGINITGGYWDPEMHATMVRDMKYKLAVYHPIEGITDTAQLQLFDMEEDPLELRNLAGEKEYAEIIQSLLLKLTDWFVQGEMQQAGRGGETIPKPSERIVNRYK